MNFPYLSTVATETCEQLRQCNGLKGSLLVHFMMQSISRDMLKQNLLHQTAQLLAHLHLDWEVYEVYCNYKILSVFIIFHGQTV